MKETRTAEPRWRVLAEGVDSTIRSGDDPHWGRAEAVAAHRWVEIAEPHSAFGVERMGDDGEGDHVRAEVTLRAADEATACARARTLFEGAMPSVSFSELGTEPLTAASVAGYRGTPEAGESARTPET